MPSTPPPTPVTPNQRRTRSSKDDAPDSPTKKGGRKPATGIEHDAKWGYIRVDKWTGPEIAEVYKVQKTKEKLKGWLPVQFENAWRGGKVDEFNGLLARYAGNWQWCCQSCYDDIPHKDVSPADYTTWDPYDCVFFDHIRFQGMALCRHVIPRPGQVGNLQKSCWYCAGGKGGCTAISHKIQVLFDQSQPVEHRISAGLELQKTPKMGAGTRESLYRETSRLFEQIVVPTLNRHSGFSVEAERGALKKKVAAVVLAGAEQDDFDPFEAARKAMNDWKEGVYEPVPKPEERGDNAMDVDPDDEVAIANKKKVADEEAEKKKLDDEQRRLDALEAQEALEAARKRIEELEALANPRPVPPAATPPPVPPPASPLPSGSGGNGGGNGGGN